MYTPLAAPHSLDYPAFKYSCFFIIGFGIKAGMVPLLWLPNIQQHLPASGLIWPAHQAREPMA